MAQDRWDGYDQPDMVRTDDMGRQMDRKHGGLENMVDVAPCQRGSYRTGNLADLRETALPMQDSPVKRETLEGWKALIGPYGHVEIAQDKNFSGYEEKDGNFIKWPESPIQKFKDLKLKTWQIDVVETFEKQDDRRILVIVDKQGGNGKSYLSRFMEATDRADVCPVVSDEYNDYSSYCIEYPAKGYVFDLPRATSIKRRSAMWMGIEQIKNGLLFEKRYKPRKVWIEPPKVLVFTNDDIPWDMLSKDRWETYELYNGQLFTLTPPQAEE